MRKLVALTVVGFIGAAVMVRRPVPREAMPPRIPVGMSITDEPNGDEPNG
jgi:hypothetical protein